MYGTEHKHVQHQSRVDGNVASAVPVSVGAAALGLKSMAATPGPEAQPSCSRQRLVTAATPDGSRWEQPAGLEGSPVGAASKYLPTWIVSAAAVPGVGSISGGTKTVPSPPSPTMVRTTTNTETRAAAEMMARLRTHRRVWGDQELGRFKATCTYAVPILHGPQFVLLMALLCLVCTYQVESVSTAATVSPAAPGGVPSLREAAAPPHGTGAVDDLASQSIQRQRHHQLRQHEASSSPSSSLDSSDSSDAASRASATSYLSSASVEDAYKGSSRNSNSQDGRLRPSQYRQGSSTRRSSLQENAGQPREPPAPTIPDQARLRSPPRNSSEPSAPLTLQPPPRPLLHHCLNTPLTSLPVAFSSQQALRSCPIVVGYLVNGAAGPGPTAAAAGPMAAAPSGLGRNGILAGDGSDNPGASDNTGQPPPQQGGDGSGGGADASGNGGVASGSNDVSSNDSSSANGNGGGGRHGGLSASPLCSWAVVMNNGRESLYGWQLVWRFSSYGNYIVDEVEGAVLVTTGDSFPVRVVNSGEAAAIPQNGGVMNFSMSLRPNTSNANWTEASLEWTSVYINGQRCVQLPSPSLGLTKCSLPYRYLAAAPPLRNQSATAAKGEPPVFTCASVFCCGELDNGMDVIGALFNSGGGAGNTIPRQSLGGGGGPAGDLSYRGATTPQAPSDSLAQVSNALSQLTALITDLLSLQGVTGGAGRGGGNGTDILGDQSGFDAAQSPNGKPQVPVTNGTRNAGSGAVLSPEVFARLQSLLATASNGTDVSVELLTTLQDIVRQGSADGISLGSGGSGPATSPGMAELLDKISQVIKERAQPSKPPSPPGTPIPTPIPPPMAPPIPPAPPLPMTPPPAPPPLLPMPPPSPPPMPPTPPSVPAPPKLHAFPPSPGNRSSGHGEFGFPTHPPDMQQFADTSLPALQAPSASEPLLSLHRHLPPQHSPHVPAPAPKLPVPFLLYDYPPARPPANVPATAIITGPPAEEYSTPLAPGLRDNAVVQVPGEDFQGGQHGGADQGLRGSGENGGGGGGRGGAQASHSRLAAIIASAGGAVVLLFSLLGFILVVRCRQWRRRLQQQEGHVGIGNAAVGSPGTHWLQKATAGAAFATCGLTGGNVNCQGGDAPRRNDGAVTAAVTAASGTVVAGTDAAAGVSDAPGCSDGPYGDKVPLPFGAEDEPMGMEDLTQGGTATPGNNQCAGGSGTIAASNSLLQYCRTTFMPPQPPSLPSLPQQPQACSDVAASALAQAGCSGVAGNVVQVLLSSSASLPTQCHGSPRVSGGGCASTAPISTGAGLYSSVGTWPPKCFPPAARVVWGADACGSVTAAAATVMAVDIPPRTKTSGAQSFGGRVHRRQGVRGITLGALMASHGSMLLRGSASIAGKLTSLAADDTASEEDRDGDYTAADAAACTIAAATTGQSTAALDTAAIAGASASCQASVARSLHQSPAHTAINGACCNPIVYTSSAAAAIHQLTNCFLDEDAEMFGPSTTSAPLTAAVPAPSPPHHQHQLWLPAAQVGPRAVHCGATGGTPVLVPKARAETPLASASTSLSAGPCCTANLVVSRSSPAQLLGRMALLAASAVTGINGGDPTGLGLVGGGATDAAADAAERGDARPFLPRRVTVRYGSSGGACGRGGSPALSSGPRRITAPIQTTQQLKQVRAITTPIETEKDFEGTGMVLESVAGRGGELGDGSGDSLRVVVIPMSVIPPAGPAAIETSSLDSYSETFLTNDTAGVQVEDGCAASAFAPDTSAAGVLTDSAEPSHASGTRGGNVVGIEAPGAMQTPLLLLLPHGDQPIAAGTDRSGSVSRAVSAMPPAVPVPSAGDAEGVVGCGVAAGRSTNRCGQDSESGPTGGSAIADIKDGSGNSTAILRRPLRDRQTEWVAIDFARDVVLERRLGCGAYGTVYRGRWAGRPVACKVVPLIDGDGGTVCPQAMESIRQEVQVLSRLSHPHIVQFYGACLAPPNVCIVEELAAGGSLHNRLHTKRRGSNAKLHPRMTYNEVLQLGLEVASAMAYLHPHIVHRDLKPQNVLLDASGHAKVCDFGIAKIKDRTLMSTRNTQAGTPAYMAPEQFEGRPVSEKVDVYAYGMTLYECITGEQPWRELQNPMQVIFVVGVQCQRPPLPAWTPSNLVQLITACWADNPEDRPPFTAIVPRLQAELSANTSRRQQAHRPELPAPGQPGAHVL